jgi:4-hydroxy-tetrahydrodipicolinate synthase
MITGSIVALVTPMHRDGSVDWEALSRWWSGMSMKGTHAIVAVGTTGESATLDVDEHLAVIKAVIKTAAGRIPGDCRHRRQLHP